MDQPAFQGHPAGTSFAHLQTGIAEAIRSKSPAGHKLQQIGSWIQQQHAGCIHLHQAGHLLQQHGEQQIQIQAGGDCQVNGAQC